MDRTQYTRRGRSFKFPSPDFHQCPILARRIPLHLHFCDCRETAAQTRETVMRQAVVESGPAVAPTGEVLSVKVEEGPGGALSSVFPSSSTTVRAILAKPGLAHWPAAQPAARSGCPRSVSSSPASR